MAHKSEGKSVLTRHLALLGAFDVDAAFLTLSQLARRSELPISSTHRLVAELESHGLLERVEDGTYRLGLQLWELAARTPGALGLREIALPYMQDVQAIVGEHTQLGVLQGTDVLFLERLSTKHAVINVTLVGGRLPLHASSSGLVLLAHSTQAFQDAVIEAPLQRFTHTTISSSAELRRVLGRVRREGFAVGDGYIHPEARGIAVPVFGAADNVIAALAIVVPNDDKPVIPLVKVLRAAADQISGALHAAYLPAGEPGAEPGGRFRPLVHSSTRSMEYLASQKGRGLN
jgi:DNA-binding IclR family transcriptional regulator